MTVFVDDFRCSVVIGGRTMIMSHMIADTRAELHAFARRLGLKRSWFQDPMVNTASAKAGAIPRPYSLASAMWHYDVTELKRLHAIDWGALPVTSAYLTEIIKQRIVGQNAQRARALDTLSGLLGLPHDEDDLDASLDAIVTRVREAVVGPHDLTLW